MERKKLVRKAEPPSKRGIAWPRWTGFRGKTVWDFLQLLIVPLMLVAIGLVFSLQQDARQRELEEQRAQDAVLQAYLDQMSTLMLEKQLRDSEFESEVRTLARARTLTVLGRLDPSRKKVVMQFLVEARLVQRSVGRKELLSRLKQDLSLEGLREQSVTGLPVISLNGADLSGVDLRELGSPALPSLIDEDGYYFDGGRQFGGIDLRGADLSDADLSSADLSDAHLTNANLIDANLSGANLSEANLFLVNLSKANLSKADLTGAEGVTNEWLDQQDASLEGATMPNGQKYEDWLEDKKAREEGG